MILKLAMNVKPVDAAADQDYKDFVGCEGCQACLAIGQPQGRGFQGQLVAKISPKCLDENMPVGRPTTRNKRAYVLKAIRSDLPLNIYVYKGSDVPGLTNLVLNLSWVLNICCLSGIVLLYMESLNVSFQ